MGVNSLPNTVTRQRRDCDLNPGPSSPESSTLTTRLPSHPNYIHLYSHKLRPQNQKKQKKKKDAHRNVSDAYKLQTAGVQRRNMFVTQWNNERLTANRRHGNDTIRYDTICYFNVRSKADMSRLNLPHGNRQLKSVRTEKN